MLGKCKKCSKEVHWSNGKELVKASKEEPEQWCMCTYKPTTIRDRIETVLFWPVTIAVNIYYLIKEGVDAW